MQYISLSMPDDLHLHLRDGDLMAHIVNYTAQQFSRALVMPNLSPPIIDVEMALAYRQRILDCVHVENRQFNPLMALYLTADMSVETIKQASACEHVYAVKYYPAHATTNAQFGVSDIRKMYPVLEAMSRHRLLLLVHGEIVDPDIDCFDREIVFIERVLAPLIEDFPDLRIVLEHISTCRAVEFIESTGKNVAATITPQHLQLNRNALFNGGLRPHHYCLPLLQSEIDRQALIKAATSLNPKFFLGTDSAPHPIEDKQKDRGCAGIFSAAFALPLYLEIFEQAGCLQHFEAFASHHGADFYGLARNQNKIRFSKQTQRIPSVLKAGDQSIVPLSAGQNCAWKLETTEA